MGFTIYVIMSITFSVIIFVCIVAEDEVIEAVNIIFSGTVEAIKKLIKNIYLHTDAGKLENRMKQEAEQKVKNIIKFENIIAITDDFIKNRGD